MKKLHSPLQSKFRIDQYAHMTNDQLLLQNVNKDPEYSHFLQTYETLKNDPFAIMNMTRQEIALYNRQNESLINLPQLTPETDPAYRTSFAHPEDFRASQTLIDKIVHKSRVEVLYKLLHSSDLTFNQKSDIKKGYLKYSEEIIQNLSSLEGLTQIQEKQLLEAKKIYSIITGQKLESDGQLITTTQQKLPVAKHQKMLEEYDYISDYEKAQIADSFVSELEKIHQSTFSNLEKHSRINKVTEKFSELLELRATNEGIELVVSVLDRFLNSVALLDFSATPYEILEFRLPAVIFGYLAYFGQTNFSNEEKNKLFTQLIEDYSVEELLDIVREFEKLTLSVDRERKDPAKASRFHERNYMKIIARTIADTLIKKSEISHYIIVTPGFNVPKYSREVGDNTYSSLHKIEKLALEVSIFERFLETSPTLDQMFEGFTLKVYEFFNGLKHLLPAQDYQEILRDLAVRYGQIVQFGNHFSINSKAIDSEETDFGVNHIDLFRSLFKKVVDREPAQIKKALGAARERITGQITSERKAKRAVAGNAEVSNPLARIISTSETGRTIRVDFSLSDEDFDLE